MTSKSAPKAELSRRLAANVRNLRTKASLTVKQAAERAGIHPRLWQKVEAGHTNATMATVVKIAAALYVDPGELFKEPAPPALKEK
jgi:transcriptional regulator with XRE-family HTH domain